MEGDVFVLFYSRCKQKFIKEKKFFPQEHQSFVKHGGGGRKKALLVQEPAGTKVEGAAEELLARGSWWWEL